MSEDRFWNTNGYISTAKFAVPDGAMTMRRAWRIFRLDPVPPKVEDINDYIVSAVVKMIRPILHTSCITTSQG